MGEVEGRLRAALAQGPRGLAAHVLRVVDEAVRLAVVHGVDVERARTAALGHDLLRASDDATLLAIATGQGYAADDVDRMAPVLLHGPLAVARLREEYGIEDADVLGAVAAHTTARAGMTRLQKLIFVADKIEPHKRARSSAGERVARLAETDLDAAVLVYLGHQIDRAVELGWPLHPNTVAARNELIARQRPQ